MEFVSEAPGQGDSDMVWKRRAGICSGLRVTAVTQLSAVVRSGVGCDVHRV